MSGLATVVGYVAATVLFMLVVELIGDRINRG